MIHKLAVVSSKAKIDSSVKIGPFCVISGGAEIGANCVLDAGVQISGSVTIGENCRFHPGAIIGGEPQDKKYGGEKSSIIIGNDNDFREYVTVNLASGEGTATIIGNDNLLMANVHIAHNCLVGDHSILANAATLAGHVILGDSVVIGGLVGIHQFVRVGAFAIVGGKSKVVQDIPPYLRADGVPCFLSGLNSVGLKRAGFSPEARDQLKKAYRVMYRQKLTTSEALIKIKEECKPIPEIISFLEFFRESKRGVSRKTR